MNPEVVLPYLTYVDMPDAWFRRFACWCVRHTPVGDGRTVWDLLTDERSRHAVEVAERFADGQATEEELNAAENEADEAASTAFGPPSSQYWLAAWAAAWTVGQGCRAAACCASRLAARVAAASKPDAHKQARQAQADHLMADEEFVLAAGRAVLVGD